MILDSKQVKETIDTFILHLKEIDYSKVDVTSIQIQEQPNTMSFRILMQPVPPPPQKPVIQPQKES